MADLSTEMDVEPVYVDVEHTAGHNEDQIPRNASSLRRLTVPPLPQNSHFNELLIDLSLQIPTETLEIIKFYYRDELKKKLSEKISNARELFSVLEERRFINPENLIHLSKMVMMIEDRDLRSQLMDRIARYSLKHSAICFRPNTDVPATGFRRVKFHVIGVGQDRYKVEEIQNLMKAVSDLTGADLSEILVDGIQPTNSIDVTLLLKNDHYQILLELTQKGTHNFGSLMVDMVTFEADENSEQKFPIEVCSGSRPDKDVTQVGESAEVTIERLNSIVEELQIQNIDHKNEIQNLQHKLNSIGLIVARGVHKNGNMLNVREDTDENPKQLHKETLEIKTQKYSSKEEKDLLSKLLQLLQKSLSDDFQKLSTDLKSTITESIQENRGIHKVQNGYISTRSPKLNGLLFNH